MLTDPSVLRVLPVYESTDEDAHFAVTDLVSVQFDELLSASACDAVLASFGLHRVDSSQYRHNYWWCALDDSVGDSPLPYGNALHLHSDVEWASATMYAQAELQGSPEDTYFGLQYYLRNTGQTGGQLDADIDADLAWDITLGGTKVAILDNGWAEHPDLPSPRVQGIWDFGDWDPYGGPPIGEPDASPGDYENHGIAVAGIIGAAHNHLGIAGICPECEIIGMKVTPDNHNILLDPRIPVNAIHLAYLLGANVISNSWSYRRRTPLTDIYNAIKYVTDGCLSSAGWRGGVAVIHSSGNYANKYYGPDYVAFPASSKMPFSTSLHRSHASSSSLITTMSSTGLIAFTQPRIAHGTAL